MTILKQKTYNHFLQVAVDKVNMLLQVLADLKESGANETKSTAGDKHETALAMLQIEQANTRAQLKEAQEQKAALEQLNTGSSMKQVVTGSLVKTNKGYFFISTALGKTMIDGMAIIAISPRSPLGSKLMGLKTNDVVEVNNNHYTIENIE
jgi:transcription elongation GreA/GreB family factor